MDFIITYTVIGHQNVSLVYMQKIKVKNNSSEKEARDKFIIYIKKKFPSNDKIIIHSCKDLKDNTMPDFMKNLFR